MKGRGDGNITIGHAWGIPIQINPSTFLILALVTWTLARPEGLLADAYPELSAIGLWLTALLTALLFFASILLHELAHAWVARRNGIPVVSITLYIFGGIAQIGGKPRTPGTEFRVAAVGPASSLVLAAIFYGLNQAFTDRGYFGASSQWLAYINMILALFNLLPGYPLDGGRILESIVWRLSGKQETGVKVAGTAGQIIAYGLIGLGVFGVFRGDVFSGIWYILIGFILHNAATTEKRVFLQQGQLAGIPVSQVMGIVREPEIPAGLTMQDLVERHILGQGQASFIVTAAGNPVGVLSLRDVSNVPRADWDQTTIGDVMTPLTDLPRVGPNDELLTAVQLMDANQLLQLPVFDGSRLAGLLTRDEVIRHLRLRSETGV
ncbi:MAG TPA: site-2 protease family protein [Thermomicrobiales bacterium]|nr:site-2 protease family protein [Thermomicrobiales bacterium]